MCHYPRNDVESISDPVLLQENYNRQKAYFEAKMNTFNAMQTDLQTKLAQLSGVVQDVNFKLNGLIKR